jgi:dihydroxyacetone kinase
MGGTPGAIFGIFLAALATLATSLRANPPSLLNPSAGYAKTIAAATTSLKQYTGAREGDRTVMDVLLPFAAKLEERGSFEKAVETAKEKAEATRFLKPKFGRSSYVGAGGK